MEGSHQCNQIFYTVEVKINIIQSTIDEISTVNIIIQTTVFWTVFSAVFSPTRTKLISCDFSCNLLHRLLK